MSAEPQTTTESNHDYSDLTGFQRDTLYVIAGMDKPSGQDILVAVDDYVSEPVTNGRMYPNLDTLVNKGFVNKGQLDRRTNYYDISEDGKEALENRREWESEVQG